MKPLDLNVSIQNSYEASRSEAVRLEKPVALSRMANEDAKRDQIMRDQTVNPPQPSQFTDDLFERDKDTEPDFTEQERGGSKKGKSHPGTKPQLDPRNSESDKVEEKPQAPEEAGFSTYA